VVPASGNLKLDLNRRSLVAKSETQQLFWKNLGLGLRPRLGYAQRTPCFLYGTPDMDPDQMDFDYRRARREEEQRLAIQAMFDVMVGRGELRTIFCPVQRRLIYFNPRRGFPTFPWERN